MFDFLVFYSIGGILIGGLYYGTNFSRGELTPKEQLMVTGMSLITAIIWPISMIGMLFAHLWKKTK